LLRHFAGTLAASVKTPITSILLAVEMSGTLTHMLPVAAVAFVALLVSDLLRTKPIYGELLERYVRAQGMQMAIASHVGSGIMELPLEMGAIADGKRVRDVRWPSGCLIIGLRRGESEIVPRGDGASVLHLSSTHRLSTRFNWYAGWWSEWVMNQIQGSILEVIRKRCEQSG